MICAFALLNNKFCLRRPLDNTFAPFLPMSLGPISTGPSKKTSKPVALCVETGVKGLGKNDKCTCQCSLLHLSA